MQNNNKTYFRIRPLTKYDYRKYVEPGKRENILELAMKQNPKLDCRGGTAKSNPYKDSYDLIIATKRADIEIMQKSVLWSPKVTPKRFKWFFVIPMTTGVLIVAYLHFIQIPKRMLHFKKKHGFVFKELESKGWLNGWIEEEYVDEIYGDEILQEFAHFAKEEEPIKIETHHEDLRKIHTKNHHSKMQNQLIKVYNKRLKKGKEVLLE